VYISPDGIASKYCTNTHFWWGKYGCIRCRKAPSNDATVFCKPCEGIVTRMAPMIVQLPKDHEKYKEVAKLFRRKWLHDTPCPKVRAVYKIVSTTKNMAKHEQYLDQVEDRRDFASKNKPLGNVKSRWHGTTRMCRLGDSGVTEFCSKQSCALCCITKTSFDISFFDKEKKWGRFGAGIYTSSVSSKSDHYSHNKRSSGWKAILLNTVVAGRRYKTTENNRTLTKPPRGYDSVAGEVGHRLNYDELVVYNNDAIRPSYLVMYDTPE